MQFPEVPSRQEQAYQLTAKGTELYQSLVIILAQFLGYDSWKTYKQEIKQRSGIESEVLFAEGIKSDDLEAGDKVKVEWLPNRKCVFRYQGNHHFEVIE